MQCNNSAVRISSILFLSVQDPVDRGLTYLQFIGELGFSPFGLGAYFGQQGWYVLFHSAMLYANEYLRNT